MKKNCVLADLPSGLNIFLADKSTGWDALLSHKFVESSEQEKFGTYHLETKGEAGEEFKLFVRISSAAEYQKVKSALDVLGHNVTGLGEVSPDGYGYIHLWFLLPPAIMPIRGEGVWRNNVWDDGEGFNFPKH